MTTAGRAPYTSIDALKYLAYEVETTVGWTVESLADDGVDEDRHPQIGEIWGLIEMVREVLGPIPEAWNNYSDGREIVSRVEVEPGLTFSHCWHPDPDRNKPQVHTGRRLSDPGEDNGTYEIRIVPPQSVTVHLFPPSGLNVVDLNSRR